MSGDNPMVTTNQFYEPSYKVGKQNIAKGMYSYPPMDKKKEAELKEQYYKKAKEAMPQKDPYVGGYNPQPTQTKP